MDHPILSLDEFAHHFRMKAQELGYDDVSFVELMATESTSWSYTQLAFGVVISGEVFVQTRLEKRIVCATEEFELADAMDLQLQPGTDGARLFIARRTEHASLYLRPIHTGDSIRHQTDLVSP